MGGYTQTWGLANPLTLIRMVVNIPVATIVLKQLHDEIARHSRVRELSASVRYIGAEMQVGVKIA